MKYTILFMPGWFPTKDSPIAGSFFKEQMDLLSKKNNFILLLYKRTEVDILRFIFHLFFRRPFIRSYFTDDIFTIETVVYLCKLKIFKYLNKIIISRNDKRIIALFRKQGLLFDLIYSPTSQINGIDANRLSNKIKIPYILSEHSPFPTLGTLLSEETKIAIERANAFVSISNDKTRQILMQNINIHPYLVGNLIDEEKFTLSPPKKNDVFNILVVAAFNFYKDYPTFFKAIKKLKIITKKAFTVTIVGYQPLNQINIWSQGEDSFIRLLDQYEITSLCKLIPKVTRDEIVSYYHGADVFVMTSIQEGFPVSALEAWSCGLPVFSTKCGGVEDFLTDNTCGYLFDLQDYKTLAERLKDYIEGTIHFDSNEIRHKVIAKYGKVAFENKMNAIFDNVVTNDKINKKINYVP